MHQSSVWWHYWQTRRDQAPTRLERFLEQMDQAMPWSGLEAALRQAYPSGRRGRRPLGLDRMLRLYFLQQWYGYSDQGVVLAPTGLDRLASIGILTAPPSPVDPSRSRLLVDHPGSLPVPGHRCAAEVPRPTSNRPPAHPLPDSPPRPAPARRSPVNPSSPRLPSVARGRSRSCCDPESAP